MTELLETRLAAQRTARTRLSIRVSGGAGEGRTPLSAFDAALRAAGVENFNLVRLSSVIPPQAQVGRVEGTEQLRGDWGDRLYCVYAEQRATELGTEAWAGVGWAFQSAADKGGLFVEHEGTSRAEVEWSIRSSLSDLTAGRPESFGPVQMQLASARCVDRPVCAIVVASYETEGWRRTARELDLTAY